MEGEIYRQSFSQVYAIQNIDLNKGLYQKTECNDCDGSGIFLITDTDMQVCNECKGSGMTWFNAF